MHLTSSEIKTLRKTQSAGLEWLAAYDKKEVKDILLPKDTITFLSVNDVLTIHKIAIGQENDVRDINALESALYRPINAHQYSGISPENAGWILAEGIVKTHPVLDGNKRTALLSMVAFWQINNIYFPNDSTWLAHKVLLLTIEPIVELDI